MPKLTRKAFLRALAGMPCLLASGCASWFYEKKEEKISRLPPVAIPKEVIVAEVSVIRAREPQLGLVAEAWDQADEQVIAIDRRRDLAANGFRCGRFGGALPQPVRDLLLAHDEAMALAEVEGESEKGDPTLTGLRMQLQAARKGEIRVRPAEPQISVLISTGDSVCGGSFPSAACSFQVRGYPAAASSAEIELLPYIEFGLPMRHFQENEGELEMNIARPKQEFAPLRMVCQLGPGEVMLVGPTTPAKGLGGVFFHEQLADPAHRLLLIRLALSQPDDVFRPAGDAKSEAPA